jgi:hypothetical protein
MPLPLGFVPPCLPTKAPQPPTGEAWLHEIKHDGFRVNSKAKMLGPLDDFRRRLPNNHGCKRIIKDY